MALGGVDLLWTATVLEGVIGTMATVALFTLMMDAADPEHAGTDYTLLASMVVLVGALAGVIAALIADAFGYAATFLLGTGLAIVGCLFLVWWLDHRPPPGRIAEAWRGIPAASREHNIIRSETGPGSVRCRGRIPCHTLSSLPSKHPGPP